MKILLIVLCIALASCTANAQAHVWQPSQGHTQVPIWPGTPPDLQPTAGPETAKPMDKKIAGKPVIAVERVSHPTMTIYSPKGHNTGVAVVVFPGGGYKILAIDLEGSEICEWLASRGITGILLKYRVPDSGPYWDPKCDCHKEPIAPTALEDAQRTIGLIRYHAAKWHINPHKIGVLGFSAGGNQVAATSTRYKKRLYSAVDAADRVSCRPDFGIALYPGHMQENTTNEYDLNPRIPVTSDTPPTFLLQAEDDPVDTVQNSLVYYAALKKAGVPVEMHLYAQGGHAFGLRQTTHPITKWPQLVETWLVTIGMISK